jgi:hypothetical protein
MRRQFEVFIDRLAVVCNQKAPDKRFLTKMQKTLEVPVFAFTTSTAWDAGDVDVMKDAGDGEKDDAVDVEKLDAGDGKKMQVMLRSWTPVVIQMMWMMVRRRNTTRKRSTTRSMTKVMVRTRPPPLIRTKVNSNSKIPKLKPRLQKRSYVMLQRQRRKRRRKLL